MGVMRQFTKVLRNRHSSAFRSFRLSNRTTESLPFVKSDDRECVDYVLLFLAGQGIVLRLLRTTNTAYDVLVTVAYL